MTARANATFDQCFFEEGVWRLDPSDEVQEDEDAEWPTQLTAWVEEEFTDRKTCPYCTNRLEQAGFFCDDDQWDVRAPFEDTGLGPDLARLWSCPYCAYWQWYSLFDNRGMHGDAGMSVLATLDAAVPVDCSTELAQHLRRTPNLWFGLEPAGMERLVADIFRANYDDAEVIHVGRPGDRGTDVIFVESNGRRWLIQAKRRERSRVEGFETLQKLLGTLVLEGQLRGIVATNGSHFSYQVRREAERASQRGYAIELFDRGKLNRMLGALLPIHPWRGFLDVLRVPKELQDMFARMTTIPHGRKPDQLAFPFAQHDKPSVPQVSNPSPDSYGFPRWPA